MSVKKTIKILDWWINQKKQGIKKLESEWNVSENDYDVTRTLLSVDKTIVANLEKIRSELIPNCKHPMNMQDKDPAGHKYCMNCNWDL
jgi:hypothetical protein